MPNLNCSPALSHFFLRLICLTASPSISWRLWSLFNDALATPSAIYLSSAQEKYHLCFAHDTIHHNLSKFFICDSRELSTLGFQRPHKSQGEQMFAQAGTWIGFLAFQKGSTTAVVNLVRILRLRCETEVVFASGGSLDKIQTSIGRSGRQSGNHGFAGIEQDQRSCHHISVQEISDLKDFVVTPTVQCAQTMFKLMKRMQCWRTSTSPFDTGGRCHSRWYWIGRTSCKLVITTECSHVFLWWINGCTFNTDPSSKTL